MIPLFLPKKMKSLFLLFGLFFWMGLQAQPTKFNYQAVVKDASGKAYINRTMTFRTSVLDSSANGLPLFQENHQTTTDSSGYFTLQIGGGSAVFGSLAYLPWNNQRDKYLKVDVDTNASGAFLHLLTSQLVSVPFALQASYASVAGTVLNAPKEQHYISSLSDTVLNFPEAIQFCDTLTEGGFSDWRMGSFDEFLDTWQTGTVFNKSNPTFWTKNQFTLEYDAVSSFKQLFNPISLGSDLIRSQDYRASWWPYPTIHWLQQMYNGRCYR
jgi:hypothetical protein